MRNSLFIVLVLAFSFRASTGLSQEELAVNMYTGTPLVEVPLWIVADHDLQQSISLTYNAKGMRLDEPSGNFGIGWDLNFGGSIKRQIRKLPDDYTGTGTDARRGWLYRTSANVAVSADVASLPNTSNLTTDCPDELTDFNKINGFGYEVDSEPDIFSYEINGHSGSFVFDNNDPPSIRLMPWADIKIEPVHVSATDKTITSFRITTNNGTIYHFNQSSNETKLTRKAAGITSVDFLKTEFEQYDSARYGTGGITYKNEWMLTKIESSLTGAAIDFLYNSQSYENRDTVRVAIRNKNFIAATYSTKDIYSRKVTGSKRRIFSIQASSGPRVEFNYSPANLLVNVTITDNRRAPGDTYVKEFNLVYTAASAGSNVRYFLNNVKQLSGCDELPLYIFTYASGSPDGTTTALPPPFSKSIDLWGYFNGKPNTTLAPTIYVYPALSLPERYRIYPIPNYAGEWYTIAGADRSADAKAIIAGSLNNIKFPGGGSTTIEYEPNDYYDAIAGQSFYGGGLRVKKITYFDGVNAAANIVKTFEYKDASNNSSGRVLVKPSFAIPTFEYRDLVGGSSSLSYAMLSEDAHDMWTFLTVRTETDIAPNSFTHGSTVGYRYVKVSRPGAGYAKYEYLMPATFGDAATGDWAPSANKFARSNACPAMGIISGGGSWSVPYATDPNYDYERGLVLNKTEYNQQNNVVREFQNTYRSIYKTGASAASKIWAVQFEKFPYSSNTFLFSKYYLLADVVKVLSTETVTTYDAPSTSIKNTDVSQYYYESSLHRLPTRVKQTLPDGTVLIKKFKYPLDYGTIPSGADKASAMIARLQSDVVNGVTITRNGSAIETVTMELKPGGVKKVVAAALVKYSDFDKGKPLLQDQFVYRVTSLVDSASFITSYVNGTTKVFEKDPNYELISSITSYGNFNKPQSVVGQDKTIASTLWGHNSSLAVAAVVNASPGEYAFSDFETTTGSEFTQAATTTGTGRMGGSGLYRSIKLTKQLTKASNQYILSFWFKKTGTLSQEFTVTTKSTTSTNVISQVFTVNPQGPDYEYVQKTVSVDPSLTSFIVELQGTADPDEPINIASSPTLLPLIDDVAFYPVHAELVSNTYKIPFGINATTSRNRSAFTEYDKLGRVKYTFDRYKNLTSKSTYSFPSDPARTFAASIALPASTSIFDGPTVFSAQDNCIDGVTYEWDFGSGYIAGSKDQTFSFTTPGSKIVKLRTTHPVYGVSTSQKTFSVSMKDCNVTTCAKGVKEYNECTGATVSTYSCSGITSTPLVLGTNFKVLSIDVSESITNYQWKIRNIGATLWSNAVTTQEYSGMKITPGTTPSYEVMCEITTSSGRKGYSAVTPVTVTTCD